MTMFIIFLRFGPNRAQAGPWMTGHKQWIQEGMAALLKNGHAGQGMS